MTLQEERDMEYFTAEALYGCDAERRREMAAAARRLAARTQTSGRVQTYFGPKIRTPKGPAK